MRLLLGDCLELMKTIPDASIDMVLADPPYGTTACKWDTVIPFEPMWRELKRLVKPKSAVLLFGSEPFSSHLRMSANGKYRYDWYWNKKFAGNFVQAKRMPLKTIESISVFSFDKTMPKYFPVEEQRETPITKGGNTQRGEAIPIRQTTAVLAFNNSRKQYSTKMPTTLIAASCRSERGFHPTPKPVALLEYLIFTYTRPGETVLDFCMGSGSTGVAAKNTGREFIGIEKDEQYFDIAKRRIDAGPVYEV